jgi:hypothetical protein
MNGVGRYWLGIGLLVLFLTLGLWVTYAMDNVHSEIAQTLDTAAAQTLSGNLPEGITLVQQAKEQWQAHWHGTASVADHAPMDEVDGLFAQLEVYGQAGLSTDFAAYCARLSNLVAAVGEAHSLTWWNLL